MNVLFQPSMKPARGGAGLPDTGGGPAGLLRRVAGRRPVQSPAELIDRSRPVVRAIDARELDDLVWIADHAKRCRESLIETLYRRVQGEASSRLESRFNNLTPPRQQGGLDDDRKLLVAPYRCRCRTCEHCGRRLGWIVRQRLHDKSHLFKVPALFTLTCGRDRFASPVDAFDFVRQGYYIARLMRALKIKRWVCVLEYQQQTGQGWPHWHLLIDKSDLPTRTKNINGRAVRIPHFLDLDKAWGLWRDKWEIGGLDLSPVAQRVTNTAHAINYITKYLQKAPRGGFPGWVLRSRKAIRFVSASKEVGALVSDAGEDETESQDETESRAGRAPYLQRMSICDQRCTLFISTTDEAGERRLGWVADVLVSRERMARLVELGKLPGHVEREADDVGRESVFITGTTIEALAAGVLKRTDEHLADYLGTANRRRVELMQQNRYAKRAFVEWCREGHDPEAFVWESAGRQVGE